MIQANLTYDNAAHVYKWRGNPVPSVTHVLSRVGVQDSSERWRPVGFDDRFLRDDTAAKFGTAFHKVVSIVLRGGVPDFPAAMAPWVNQLWRWLQDNPVTPLHDVKSGEMLIECPMYHETYGYAGTPDAVVLTPKKDVILLDWKTSTVNQKHWRLQTAAYAELVKHVMGIRKPIIRKTVRFTEERAFTTTREHRPEDWTGFQSCLNVLRIAA